MTTTKVPRLDSDQGGAENNAAGGLSYAIVSNRPDNRVALRSLLARIDVAEPVRVASVQAAIRDALPEVHLRRSAEFEAARPRPGDYNGRCTPAELAEADQRCAQISANLRAHARLLAEVEAGEW